MRGLPVKASGSSLMTIAARISVLAPLHQGGRLQHEQEAQPGGIGQALGHARRYPARSILGDQPAPQGGERTGDGERDAPRAARAGGGLPADQSHEHEGGQRMAPLDAREDERLRQRRGIDRRQIGLLRQHRRFETARHGGYRAPSAQISTRSVCRMINMSRNGL
jgi:hypothetical protein